MQDTAKVNCNYPMSQAPGLKVALKRGALIAAANWPLVVVQFIADATFKVLLAVPVSAASSWWCCSSTLTSKSCCAATARDRDVGRYGVARQPGRAGGVLGRVPPRPSRWIDADVHRQGRDGRSTREADAHAGPIERPPLRFQAMRRANRTSRSKRSSTAAGGCGCRYVKLGACLLLVYTVTAAAYLGLIFGGYALVGNSGDPARLDDRGGRWRRAR